MGDLLTLWFICALICSPFKLNSRSQRPTRDKTMLRTLAILSNLAPLPDEMNIV